MPFHSHSTAIRQAPFQIAPKREPPQTRASPTRAFLPRLLRCETSHPVSTPAGRDLALGKCTFYQKLGLLSPVRFLQAFHLLAAGPPVTGVRRGIIDLAFRA